MSFIDNVAEILQTEQLGLNKFRVVILSNGCFIEGVKSLKDYSPNKIELIFNHGQIKVVGENLKIAKYYGGDIAIKGKILCWERI